MIARQQVPTHRSRPPRRPLVVRATNSRTVAIAGAGISGLATAVGLHKLGVPVVVLERAPELRQEGSALSLWANAWRGLDALGVSDQLRQESPLLESIEFVSSSGKLLKQFNLSQCGQAARAAGGVNETRGVSRPRLLSVLADQLPPGSLKFNCSVVGMSDLGGSGTRVQLADGSSLSCDVLVGADGANSKLAQQLGLPQPNYAGYVAYRGLAEYPAGSSLPLPSNTIRQMFGRGVRAGMYPITQQQVYWFICFNAAEGAPKPATAADRVAEALSAVEGWSWGIQEAVRRTDPDSISRSGIRDRWTSGSVGRGCVTVIGDALHPMTPNLGQGGCTAIEDAVVLARQLGAVLNSSSSKADIEACLRSFEAERARRCLAITVRAHAMGAALQLPFAPVCSVRDLVLEKRLDPSHFLDHTSYDCGTLTAA